MHVYVSETGGSFQLNKLKKKITLMLLSLLFKIIIASLKMY